ncbi:Hypothetical protein HVPorG_03895 (plasmid) [Roseomonas mucosa]|uniref:hypothetical protein n=1 Tax=Roseomonas mucosa TaxID=207340 RepID=UPI0021FC1704|nr:hypothetical protein [Roseomonas mucosa]QDJ12060.1 Hypothetical protein HVPorG_03895 [Roseomonas mucosa]UZO94640.1 Hypothetical protein RMP42_03895 [Roseomonas mucosa]
MATTSIILSAYPGRRIREGGCTSTQIGLCIGGGAPQRHLAVEGLGGITLAVAQFGRDVLAANPGASFDISVGMAKGQRKPRGFDDAEKAETFGHHAFLREDAGDDATYRKLTSPPASGAVAAAALAA